MCEFPPEEASRDKGMEIQNCRNQKKNLMAVSAKVAYYRQLLAYSGNSRQFLAFVGIFLHFFGNSLLLLATFWKVLE